MSTSNINLYYDELVADIAQNVLDDENYKDNPDDTLYNVIGDYFIYYTDLAYLMAYAINSGYIQWGDDEPYAKAYDMITEHVRDEKENMKKGEV